MILAHMSLRHSRVKGIQVCSNEGASALFQGEIIAEQRKIHWQNLKISFLGTTGPFQPNLAQSILMGEGVSIFRSPE